LALIAIHQKSENAGFKEQGIRGKVKGRRKKVKEFLAPF